MQRGKSSAKRKLRPAKTPRGKISPWQNFHATKIPHGKISAGKINGSKFSRGEITYNRFNDIFQHNC